ncbi:hypothetical protein [Carnimonas nigrificans]|uniref:hypothetical protein n=1 Tax=Carnimonas nigrificans TaxID=64323 RepID=UPI00046ED55A|nr:hypothetical protein [Carnimonas nigrificans]
MITRCLSLVGLLTLPLVGMAEPIDLSVPGPDFEAEAHKYGSRSETTPPLSDTNPYLISQPPKQRGVDVHGGLEAGYMTGSHGASGHYTAGHVHLDRGNTRVTLGFSESKLNGGNWGR